MRTLHQCLLDVELARLRAIARFWDVAWATSRRPAIVAQLAQEMAKPDLIASTWQALPDDERRALGALLTSGGRMPFKSFTRRWGEIRAMGPGRMEREQPWRAPISPAEDLWYKGFIYRAFEQQAGEAYEVVCIPLELRRHLPAAPAPSPSIALEPVSEPSTVLAAGDAALDDTCTILTYLQNEPVRASRNREWPVQHIARLRRRLHTPDPDRLGLLQHLIHQLGWLRMTDAGHLRPAPEPVKAWLEASTEQQRQALAMAWRESSTWNDLFHVPTLCCEDTGAWRNDPALARRAILQHLTPCAPDAWYSVEAFIAAVKQIDPDFQRPDGDYTTWYIREKATGTYLTGFASWDAVEGALIRYVLTQPMAWLGLVDVGAPSAGQPPATFRLTRAGAAFLGKSEPPPGRRPGPLVLRDDFTVLVPPERRFERFQLARIANWARTGAPYVYRLTPASLARARQQGIPVARVLEFLGRVTEAPVPRFAEAALTRWEARGVEVSLERVVLLRLSSEELMARIAASPQTRRLVQEQVGPKAALVRQQDWPHLTAALAKMALLPDVVNLEGDCGAE